MCKAGKGKLGPLPPDLFQTRIHQALQPLELTHEISGDFILYRDCQQAFDVIRYSLEGGHMVLSDTFLTKRSHEKDMYFRNYRKVVSQSNIFSLQDEQHSSNPYQSYFHVYFNLYIYIYTHTHR